MYKVCWAVQNGACAGADILKGFDDAIKDGVHVLTLSIAASSLPLYSEVDGRDSIAIGSFHAVQRGIAVVCGAGNNGPSPQTVKNIAPWIINVAATTMDRAFRTQITLGNNITFMVSSKYLRMPREYVSIHFRVTKKNQLCRLILSTQLEVLKASFQACSTPEKHFHQEGWTST